jgi:hypothetical protein
VTPTKIVIEVGGQSITFDREKVRAFYSGTPPPGAGARAESPTILEEALAALKGPPIHLVGRVKYLLKIDLLCFDGQSSVSRLSNRRGP